MSGVGPPLAGIQVLELANYVTGPYATALLAEMGADVLKIEERTQGDPFRNWGAGGYSPTFRSVNRGKRSLGLDVRTPEGRDILQRLAAQTDVLVENFRPGVADRLGVGYEAVSAANPRVVYCSISGFGSIGPYRDRPGYDTVGQAMSGLLSLLTDMHDPKMPGVSLADHLTAIFASHGVLAALVSRGVSGEGRRVETSLLQATMSFIGENAVRFLEDGKPQDSGSRARLAQAYAFVAGDGKPFAVHLSSPQKFFEGLTKAIGRPELFMDPRFDSRAGRAQNYDLLRDVLNETFATNTRAHWLAALEDADVPASPIYDMQEAFADPQVRALQMVREFAHSTKGIMRYVSSAVSISEFDGDALLPPPLLGEHTEQVLDSLGYSAVAIQRLREAEII